MLRPMTTADLADVLSWRNHPQVRRHMFDARAIEMDSHRAWFERQATNDRMHLFVFAPDDQPMGFVKLEERAGQAAGEWGFYAAPGAPKGTGRRLGAAALDHAFGALNWHKVNGMTLGSNERSIRMHLALGFRQEGVLREHHYDGQAFHDVCCFGLLRCEWPSAENLT